MSKPRYTWAYATNPDCAADYRRMGYQVGEPFARGRGLCWPVAVRAGSLSPTRIVLTPYLGRKRTYTTLAGARVAALRMLGERVHQDPDGYATGDSGKCLWFTGCTFEELFS